MNDQPRDLEHTSAATFLLVHAIMLGVLDLTVAMGAFLGGVGGMAVMSASGLQDASVVFGVSLVVGLVAAMILAWMGVEILFAVRALRGEPRSLLLVSMGGLVLSVVMLPILVLPCGLFGLGITVPLVLMGGVATAFAAMPPTVPRAPKAHPSDSP